MPKRRQRLLLDFGAQFYTLLFKYLTRKVVRNTEPTYPYHREVWYSKMASKVCHVEQLGANGRAVRASLKAPARTVTHTNIDGLIHAA